MLGTVKGDIHEFGKNIAGTVLSSNGIRVVDLGVDVDHQAWVDAINESGATLVGMSALLTTVFDGMREAIATIERAGLRDKVTILVGGGPMTEEAATYVGADHYCKTAQDGVTVAKNVLGVSYMAEQQGPPRGSSAPNPLFLERMGRIQTAIHCGTPDRVPLSLVLDTFACNLEGVKYPTSAPTSTSPARRCWPPRRSSATSTPCSGPATPRPSSACSGSRR